MGHHLFLQSLGCCTYDFRILTYEMSFGVVCSPRLNLKRRSTREQGPCDGKALKATEIHSTLASCARGAIPMSADFSNLGREG